MDLADIYALLDRKYRDNPVPCPNEGKPARFPSGRVSDIHGNLHVHGSTHYLVCGTCGHQEPIARP